MTEKFTPGPWRYCAGAAGKGACKCGCIMDEEAHIAEVFGPYHQGDGIDGPDTVPDREHQKANMRLIASAPELYDALFRLLELQNYCEYTEGEPDVCPGIEIEGHPCHWCQGRAALRKACGEGDAP